MEDIKELYNMYANDMSFKEIGDVVENHLQTCKQCTKYLQLMEENSTIEPKIEKSEIDIRGEKIVKEIKKSQDRIKYTFIIFSMIVAVSNGWLSKGFMSTIPLVIIIPFILSLFFKEGKIILLTAVCSNLVLSLATDNWDLGIISTPLLIVAVLLGVFLGKCIKNMKEGE